MTFPIEPTPILVQRAGSVKNSKYLLSNIKIDFHFLGGGKKSNLGNLSRNLLKYFVTIIR